MLIHTTARHCELDPDVRSFTQQRLSKFAKFARDLSEAHVTVTAEGYRHVAEITIALRGKEIMSRESSTEPRAAIDLAADRIEHQLRRLKEQRIERWHGRGANGAAPNGEPGATPTDAGAGGGGGEEDAFDFGEE